LEEVLSTGVPLEIRKGGKILRIVTTEPVDKFRNLTTRPGVIQGDPDDRVEISWEEETNFDLP